MNRQKRTRAAFRPSVDESKLEDRVVLATSGVTFVQTLPSLAAQLTPASSPFSPLTRLTAQQVRSAFTSQLRATNSALRSAIRSEVNQLFANGRPTAQQMADFNATVAGRIDAAAFRTGSQALLLPGRSQQLASNLELGLLGSSSRSLLSQIQTATATPRFTNSARALNSALSQQLNRSLQTGTGQLNNFFNTTNLNRLSVNSTGQRIPLQTFFGNQILAQQANTFGTLGQSFANQANTLLFQNGVTPTNAALNTFNSGFNQALNTAAFQLVSDLSLFNGGTGVAPQVQQNLFGSGSNALINSVLSVQNQANNFATNVANGFNTGFSSLATPVGNFFGLGSRFNTTLPVANNMSIFDQALTGNSFNSGFNNGFGSGFPGFGTASTGFNNNFGTGFNNFVTGTLGSAGFANHTSTNSNFAPGTVGSLFGKNG